jgi:TIR domain-containing protein
MKVFWGWSGETSHKIALALHNWLPRVIQAIKPYISSEDIAKGARWSTEIANELQTTNYGIICVTKENIGSPWINFESGALSREIGKSFVTPFLFQLKPSDIQGPLAQFQAVNEKDEMLKLVSSINGRQETDQRLEKTNLQAESLPSKLDCERLW